MDYTDRLGIEIIGLKEATTDEDKIKVLEKHLVLLEGLTNEAMSGIRNKIADIKYPDRYNTTKT